MEAQRGEVTSPRLPSSTDLYLGSLALSPGLLTSDPLHPLPPSVMDGGDCGEPAQCSLFHEAFLGYQLESIPLSSVPLYEL